MDLATVRIALHEAVARVLPGAVDEHVRTILDHAAFAGVLPRAFDLKLRAVRTSDASRARRLPVAVDVAAVLARALDLTRARVLSSAADTTGIGAGPASDAPGAGVSTTIYDAVESRWALDFFGTRAVGAAVIGAGLSAAIRGQRGRSALR